MSRYILVAWKFDHLPFRHLHKRACNVVVTARLYMKSCAQCKVIRLKNEKRIKVRSKSALFGARDTITRKRIDASGAM
jgi:hypothetical protein